MEVDSLKHYIYLLTNKITNEKYVGETTLGIEARFKEHCRIALNGYRDKYRLYLDIKKFSPDNFKVELLEELDIEDKKEAWERESYWIEKLDTYNNGYNNAPRHTVGGLGYCFTEERKKEYSKIFSGKNNPMYGKDVRDYMTEEEVKRWKENLSKAKKGKKFSESHKKALSENSTRKRKVIKTTSDGKITIYDSLTKASQDNKLSLGGLSNRIKKKLIINGESYKYED